jgi:Cu(I)/Ag(I) efflux system membrane fusion protein
MVTTNDSNNESRALRRILSSVLILALGVAAGAGLVWAHYAGHLRPLYHALGLHFAHQQTDHAAESTQAAPAGHVHGGMSMPKTGGAEPSKIPGYALVTIVPERQQAIGVRTGKVEHGLLRMSIRAVGILEPDQSRLFRPHTRISGWVTKVHVNFVGQNVKKGDPLLEIYSPDLVATQQEYVNALAAWEQAGKTEALRRLMDASRQRLELWDVPADEIQELAKTRKPRESLVLRSKISGRVLERNVQEGSYVEPAMELYRIADLSVLWLQAKIYEYELPHIELGQPVQVSLVSKPGVTIAGKVSFVEPVLQETTRTVKVRVVIDNPKDEFKPGMYADLVIEHDMGHGLLVPESAVLRTGERDLTFRVLPGHRFEPVEVKLGGRFQGRYQVLAGLNGGDEIVTSAGFLIDAESRLRSATAAMTGHDHGAAGTQAPKQDKGGHEGHH